MKIYFVQFLAYTMAMVGFLSVCLLTYKKFFTSFMGGKNADYLQIENMIRINPKKQILIIRAGEERFLVASDSETTTMLAKLNDKEQKNIPELIETNQTISFNQFKQTVKKNVSLQNELPALKRIKEKMKA